MLREKRVIVAGAGAIGSALGGYLAECGVPVVLVARPAHAEAIRTRGLTLRTPRGVLRPKLSAVASVTDVSWEPGDVILLASKSQDTRALLEEIAAPHEVPVVCCQNGVRNEEWAQARFERVYGLVPWFSVNYLGPGTVEHTVRNGLVLGSFPTGVDGFAEELASAFRESGFDVRLHPHVMSHKWGKLVVNLNNALYPIVDTWQQKAYTEPALRAFMVENMREGVAVLKAAGIDPIVWPNDRPVDDFIAGVAAGALAHHSPDAIPEGERSYPSTWQDVRLGRTSTEIEFFNGEIVELGRTQNVPTPYSQTLLDMMREIVASRSPPGLYTLDDVRARVERASAFGGA